MVCKGVFRMKEETQVTATMDISDFNIKTADRSARALESGYQFKPQIICNDGFKMSVQGSSGHYCSPRELSTDYYEMEVGYPSEIEPLLLPYAENKITPTETVYGWVPCNIIDEVIVKHGGINQELTFVIK